MWTSIAGIRLLRFFRPSAVHKCNDSSLKKNIASLHNTDSDYFSSKLENKLVVQSINIISWRKGHNNERCMCIPTRFHLTEQPHENVALCEQGRLELKVMVNSTAPWPRHGPQGIGEVYQCWCCLAVTEPDWQLLSVCSLSVISFGHVPTLCAYQARTTWLQAGHIYSLDQALECVCVNVCMERQYKYPTLRK